MSEEEILAYKEAEKILENYRRGIVTSIDIELLDTLVKTIKKQSNMLSNISDEFLKYDWKNSDNEQIYNQLKSLHKSIFEKGE